MVHLVLPLGFEAAHSVGGKEDYHSQQGTAGAQDEDQGAVVRYHSL